MTESPTPEETEGTIRFAYALETPEAPVTDQGTLSALAGWRILLKRLALVGQQPGRYGGLGFGNLSARDPLHPAQFVITASQTSGAERLVVEDLVRIVDSSTTRFWVDALGHQPPSSETLTHAMIYQADPAIRWIFHAHSPEIWHRAEALGLPATAATVNYGTPDMAHAVAELLTRERRRPIAFVTLGHRDGVFACGESAEEAGGALMSALAQALT